MRALTQWWAKCVTRCGAVIAAAIIAGTAPAVCAAPVSRTGVATATIIRPLTVTAVADMDFGTISHSPGIAGSVTVSPASAGASFTGGASAICIATDCAIAHAAQFAVTGEPRRSYTIQLPPIIVATSSTGGGALTVSGLTVRTVNGGQAPQLDSGGADGFAVGGTIVVSADLPAARYRASFAVIVSYI